MALTYQKNSWDIPDDARKGLLEILIGTGPIVQQVKQVTHTECATRVLFGGAWQNDGWFRTIVGMVQTVVGKGFTNGNIVHFWNDSVTVEIERFDEGHFVVNVSSIALQPMQRANLVCMSLFGRSASYYGRTSNKDLERVSCEFHRPYVGQCVVAAAFKAYGVPDIANLRDNGMNYIWRVAESGVIEGATEVRLLWNHSNNVTVTFENA